MAVVAPTMDLNLPNDKKECSGSAFAWFLAMMAGPRTHSNYMAVGAAVLLEHSGGALAQPVDALGGQLLSGMSTPTPVALTCLGA